MIFLEDNMQKKASNGTRRQSRKKKKRFKQGQLREVTP